jgi:hypothetical protein
MIWSTEAIANLHRYAAAGLTGSEIAERFCCSRGAITGKCSHVGIKLNAGRGSANRMRQQRIRTKFSSISMFQYLDKEYRATHPRAFSFGASRL